MIQNEEEYFQILSSYDRGLTQIAPATAVAYTSFRGHPDELYNPETNLRVIIDFLRNRGFKDESDAGLNGAIIANTIVNTNSRTGTTVEGHLERATGYWADLTNKAKIECHSPCTVTFNNPIVMYREEFQNAVLIKSKNAKISKDFSIIENFEGDKDSFYKLYLDFYNALFTDGKIDAFRFYLALINIGINSEKSKLIVANAIVNLYARNLLIITSQMLKSKDILNNAISKAIDNNYEALGRRANIRQELNLKKKYIINEINRLESDIRVWSIIIPKLESSYNHQNDLFFEHNDEPYMVTFNKEIYGSNIVEHFIRRHVFGDMRNNEKKPSIFSGYLNYDGRWRSFTNLPESVKLEIIKDVVHRLFSVISTGTFEKNLMRGFSNRQMLEIVINDGEIVNVVSK